MATFRCDDCGKTFKTNGALGSHRTRVHGSQELRDEITQAMQTLLTPLLTRLEEIEKELEEARKRVTKLTADRNYLTTSIRRLNPDLLPESKPGPRKLDDHAKARSQAANDPERRTAVMAAIEGREWENGFTRKDIHRALVEMRTNGAPVIGKDSVDGVIGALHESGVIRVDRTVRGGAPVFKLVGA